MSLKLNFKREIYLDEHKLGNMSEIELLRVDKCLLGTSAYMINLIS